MLLIAFPIRSYGAVVADVVGAANDDVMPLWSANTAASTLRPM